MQIDTRDKRYCPACSEITEHEGEDDAYCSVCGRTKHAAELAVAAKKSKARRQKIDLLLIVLGVYAFAALIVFWPGDFVAPAIKGITQAIGTGVIVGIFLLIRKLLKK